MLCFVDCCVTPFLIRLRSILQASPGGALCLFCMERPPVRCGHAPCCQGCAMSNDLAVAGCTDCGRQIQSSSGQAPPSPAAPAPATATQRPPMGADAAPVPSTSSGILQRQRSNTSAAGDLPPPPSARPSKRASGTLRVSFAVEVDDAPRKSVDFSDALRDLHSGEKK